MELVDELLNRLAGALRPEATEHERRQAAEACRILRETLFPGAPAPVVGVPPVAAAATPATGDAAPPVAAAAGDADLVGQMLDRLVAKYGHLVPETHRPPALSIPFIALPPR